VLGLTVAALSVMEVGKALHKTRIKTTYMRHTGCLYLNNRSREMSNFRKLKEHAETEELRDAIVELVLEVWKEDPRLNFYKIDQAFCLAWNEIEYYNEDVEVTYD
jgi:hypothetical protein